MIMSVCVPHLRYSIANTHTYKYTQAAERAKRDGGRLTATQIVFIFIPIHPTHTHTHQLSTADAIFFFFSLRHTHTHTA